LSKFEKPKGSLMILGIMQPYFFPYLGYFSLIKYSDQFVLFDIPQFIRHGWIARNRILKSDGDPLYINVPLIKHHRNTNIRDIRINNTQKWGDKILAQLNIYKKKAPHYYSTLNFFTEIIDFQTDSIVELNYNTLTKTCAYLGIQTPISILSDLNLQLESASAPDDWALNISKALNAKIYCNPASGESIFDVTKYDDAGINLQFLDFQVTEYKQFLDQHTPALSVLDAMMFCSIDEIQSMIDNYTITS
jgi:WbqC-like protein